VVTRAEAESYTKLLAVMARLRPDVKLLMLAPRIVTAAKWLMREYRARLCDAGHGPFPGGNTPSSGLVAAYILVQACDQLNLFGFGGDASGDASGGGGGGGAGGGGGSGGGSGGGGSGGGGGGGGVKYHYYTGVGHRTVGTVVHSWGAELELLDAMEREGRVTVCTSRDQDECVDPAAAPRVAKRAQAAAVEVEVGGGHAKAKRARDDPVAAELTRAAGKDKVTLELEEALDAAEGEEAEAEGAAAVEVEAEVEVEGAADAEMEAKVEVEGAAGVQAGDEEPEEEADADEATDETEGGEEGEETPEEEAEEDA